MIDVLIVEDDFMVARIHGKFVERTPGFRVVDTIHTGSEALRAVREMRPDLVLLDIHLPDISGLEILHDLRAERVPVGVIIITAAREAHSVRAALEGGASHYIIKPFEYEDLVVQLERFKARHAALNDAKASRQQDVNRIFGYTAKSTTPSSDALPKGLSVETVRIVHTSLSEGGEMSASECADATGISRVSVRRYLEYFAGTGHATVRLEYGRAGRPERRYRLLRHRPRGPGVG